MTALLQQLDFVLPGEWWAIPLTRGDGEIDRSAAALAALAYGKRDDRAMQRADVRARVRDAADKARRLGGSQLHLALRIVGEIPLPAALTVIWPDVTVSRDSAIAIEELHSSLPAVKNPTVLEDCHLPTVRAVWSTLRTPEDASDAPRLEASYWVAAGHGRLVVFSFDSILADYRDAMVELFDAIMATVQLHPHPLAGQ